jgi:hypothetical protein
MAKISSDDFVKVIQEPIACSTRDCSLVHSGGLTKYKNVTLTGNGASTENLFTVTEAVRVMAIYFVVGTVGAGGAGGTNAFSLVKFETDDAGAQDDITNTVDCSGAVAGALAYRKAVSGTALAFLNAASCGIDESATNKVNFEFQVVQKTAGVNSYVRLSYTGDADTDVEITAYIRYQPLTEDASIDAV